MDLHRIIVVAFLVVYTLRTSEFDQSWKIGVAAGAVADIIVIVAGSIVFSVQIDYVTLIFGNIISVLLALILEFFIFCRLFQGRKISVRG